MRCVRVCPAPAAAVLGRHEEAAHLGVVVAVPEHVVEEVGDLSGTLGGEHGAQVGKVVDMATRLRTTQQEGGYEVAKSSQMHKLRTKSAAKSWTFVSFLTLSHRFAEHFCFSRIPRFKLIPPVPATLVAMV